jgi:hypothetical protein
MTENGELLATYDTVEHLFMVSTKAYLAREKAKTNAKAEILRNSNHPC